VAAVCAMPVEGPDLPDEMGDAMIHAADKYSRDLGARASGPAVPRGARQPALGGSGRAAGRVLPGGYLALGEVKDLSLLGYWPLLEDGMSACMPTRIVSVMQHRSSLDDQEAAAWLELHAHACAGDPEAQRTFGRACENGAYRAAADVQRAFF